MRHKCSWVESHTTLHRSVRLPLVSWLTQHKAQADYGFVGTDSTVGSQTVVVKQRASTGPGPAVTKVLLRPYSHHLDRQEVTSMGLLSKPPTSKLRSLCRHSYELHFSFLKTRV